MREARRVTSVLKFGPGDHGLEVTEEELESAEYQLGFKYEVIDGRLYVSPTANLPENRLESWLFVKLHNYTASHPEVINWITTKPRVFVPRRPRLTVPEPDIGAYHNFPVDSALDDVRWNDLSPLLVAEVLLGHPEKDLVRNVELFWLVPTIREYWVLDGREDANRPTLIVHRRHGKRWVIREHPFDSTYTTRLLPDFELRINPRR